VIEANGSNVDCKRLVRAGYDACAESYAAARAQDDSEQLAPLLELLPARSSVLDLGCGSGVPIALKLAERHSVTGVDASEGMLSIARANVPGAHFVRSDLLEVVLEKGAFDAAVAIFVLFHLPREEHRLVFDRVWSWLRPGGYFLVSLTESAESPYIEHDFFGTDMYWSNWDYQEYRRLLAASGFEMIGERILGHGYGRTFVDVDERHPTALVRKPAV
jgi:SAM-dependent methyltransferase